MEQIFDSDIGFASSDSEFERPKKKLRVAREGVEGETKRQNVLLKVLHRQRTGYFASDFRSKSRQTPFTKVPQHLSFCLKEIIPVCFLDGHIFMGLSLCGQFLISYKGVMDSLQLRNYDFTALHRYELFFWIFRPHCPLHKYFSVCLFDDHGVDGTKSVTMTQWTSDSGVLVVHGESDRADNDSYVTYVKIPRLGCLDCKELRDEFFDGTSPREAMLCIKCAMTVHMKYRLGENGTEFDPSKNFNCPHFMVLSENTFIHAVSIDLGSHKRESQGSSLARFTPTIGVQRLEVLADSIFEKRKSIAEEIIADFEEYETEGAEMGTHRDATLGARKKPIFQKVEGTSQENASKCSKKDENLYEFSEDNEKCEKISTFRKRCLADKKYEFSEETLDNILPFNRIRNRIRNRIGQPSMQQSQDLHLHRSPNQGFRSPCGSPVGSRFLRSPPGFHSPNYHQRSPIYAPKYAMLAPRKSDPLRRISSPTYRPFYFDMAPENNENRNSSNLETRVERQEEPWKVTCSKKVTRYFVEEDDANSVITTEEDDCISPGYHTSLPLEVHGACYSNMQPISHASYSQLNCPGVLITQNTLDTEALTVHMATFVCGQHNKIYDMLSDSSYSILQVCPVTFTIICTIKVEFFATDMTDESASQGLKVNRKKYCITPLFVWNIQDGSLSVIAYGKLQALRPNQSAPLKSRHWLSRVRDGQIEDSGHLRIHKADVTKTKERLTDLKNMIEFYRGGDPSDYSSSDSSDGASDSEDAGIQNSS